MREILAVYRHELGRMFRLKPVVSVLIGAVAFYALFYPQPYLNEALRDVPIALVDLDGTTDSRDLARRVAATEGVNLAFTAPDLADAERAVQARQAYSILLIPQNFERDLRAGRPSPLAAYADASYFLLYQRVSGAITSAARTVGAEVEAARLIGRGLDSALAAAATDPLPLTSVSLFNPQGGYATYLLPATLVLILQQTLLIGVGLLGTLPGGPRATGPMARLAGKLMAYVTLESVVLPLYLIGLPFLYGVPRIGGLGPLAAVALPFILAVAGLGLVLAKLCRTPIAVQLATAGLGLPFFFIAGFSWPTEAMPPAIQALALLVPSTTAIESFVAVNQMGATISEIGPKLLRLWGIAIFYCTFAGVLEAYLPLNAAIGFRPKTSSSAHAPDG